MGNEPTARALAALTSRDGFLVERREALLSTPDDFALKFSAGCAKYEWLQRGFAEAERGDLIAPRFYDAPELRQVRLDDPEG